MDVKDSVTFDFQYAKVNYIRSQHHRSELHSSVHRRQLGGRIGISRSTALAGSLNSVFRLPTAATLAPQVIIDPSTGLVSFGRLSNHEGGSESEGCVDPLERIYA